MGYNTTINILNDSIDIIEKHPDEFVRGVLDKMVDGGTVGIANHVNPVQVMRTGDASEFRLYSVHANSMIELSGYSTKTEEIAKRLPEVVRSSIKRARRELDLLERHLEVWTEDDDDANLPDK